MLSCFVLQTVEDLLKTNSVSGLQRCKYFLMLQLHRVLLPTCFVPGLISTRWWCTSSQFRKIDRFEKAVGYIKLQIKRGTFDEELLAQRQQKHRGKFYILTPFSSICVVESVERAEGEQPFSSNHQSESNWAEQFHKKTPWYDKQVYVKSLFPTFRCLLLCLSEFSNESQI